ncbi:MAG: fibronectin type III domain-containing protein [Nitrospirae bacterium]|nr:fibronectin type III domain-containing protein [Nitrospirota bacterium]
MSISVEEEEINALSTNILKLLSVSLFLFIFVNPAFSAEVTLSWDPPVENIDGTPLVDLAGYKIYYGTSSGVYTNVLDVKDTTTYTITGLPEGFTYYFAVTAYDIYGNESEFSNEVSKTIPPSPLYRLAVFKNGDGSGTVSSTTPGISCGSDCDEYLPAGTVVTLNYSASLDSLFSGWSGDCTGSSSSCTIIMDSDKTIGATFSKKSFSITATAGLNGMISPSGTTTVSYGDSVTYTITADSGYVISDVVVDGLSIGAVNSYTFFSVTSNHTIEAYFSPVQTEPDIQDNVTVYEDAEDGTISGWEVYDDDPDWAYISNIYDTDRQSRVIEFNGYGLYNGYRLRNPDMTFWNNTEQHIIEWSFKFNEIFMVFIDVDTANGHRYISYIPINWEGSYSGEYLFLGLGENLLDNTWQRVVRDLEADLKSIEPYNSITKVNAFLIYGSGRIDDIKLHSSMPLP